MQKAEPLEKPRQIPSMKTFRHTTPCQKPGGEGLLHYGFGAVLSPLHKESRILVLVLTSDWRNWEHSEDPMLQMIQQVMSVARGLEGMGGGPGGIGGLGGLGGPVICMGMPPPKTQYIQQREQSLGMWLKASYVLSSLHLVGWVLWGTGWSFTGSALERVQ
ncbi:hypothetical protein B9Z19DRAFT_1136377 [Tuber borchii]|uniref:Uncharacterized protein n=1 Tax=Tuber borchii TaxID=42251 RepID=A0A2T6ZBP1_TUBBO|nr:hypothetical protein B9Z19DRAFT_1136377 [Tuber borchii]